MTLINRRALLTGLINLVAAPAIVRAGSIMPVRTMLPLFESEDTIFICVENPVSCRGGLITHRSLMRSLSVDNTVAWFTTQQHYELGDVIKVRW